ncbi:MAG: 7-cyano-7-deazaguanine synthase QueC [Candidatus Omnitrophica bacterium]|nr:7-cyano-7-deazaguanine synthase QueC [Candidatus Omnitrophota bacterium]MCK5493339.1 7-cyano-7-deazaguanine synthase QueC [Candidatus Omnitrophota bacterium]
MRDKKKVKKGVILLSGGADSVTTFYWAKKKGYDLTAIIFDYNQRHKKEIKCAKNIADLNYTKYFLVKGDLSWTKSSLTDMSIKVPSNGKIIKGEIPVTYVSGRNIVFLSYAFSLAESIGAKYVFIGAHIQDYSGYPDCRPEFLDKFEETANLGLKNKGIKLIAPLISKSKKTIVKMGVELGVPFEDTWSCYKGMKSPCLTCDSCRFRIQAFNELGLKDPLLK